MQHVHRLDLAVDRTATRQGRSQQVFAAEFALTHGLAHRPGVQALIVAVRHACCTGIGKAPEQADARYHGAGLEDTAPGQGHRRVSGNHSGCRWVVGTVLGHGDFLCKGKGR
ncbi:hypothetical protein D3C77_488750 [compost metagenome]